MKGLPSTAPADGHSVRSAQVRAGLSFFLPFGIFLLADGLLGRTAFSFVNNDGLPALFGMGLNVVTGDGPLRYHLPGLFFQWIAGILAWPFTQSANLDGFFQLGRFAHLLFGVVIAAWVGAMSPILGLSCRILALISAIAISMPTMAVFAPVYVPFFPTGYMAVPVALGLFAIASHEAPPRWLLWTVFAGMGFVAANNIMAVILIMAAIPAFAVLAVAEGPGNTLRRLSVDPLPDWSAVVFPILATCALVSCIEAFRQLLGFRMAVGLRWIVAFVASLAFAWLTRNGALRRLRDGLVMPAFAGWAIGVNTSVFYWASIAWHASRNKGNASPQLPFAEVWHRADPLPFFQSQFWHLFVPLAFLVAAAIAILGRRRPNLLFAATFALVLIVLNMLMAADISFLNTPLGIERYGLASRYFLMAIAPVTLVCAVAATMAGLRRSATAAFAVLCLLSVADYVQAVRFHWPAAEAREKALEAAIDRHLAASPENRVACTLILQPRPCMALYGYNSYRLPDSILRLERTSLHGGRVFFLRNHDNIAQLDAGTLIILDIGAVKFAPSRQVIFDDGHMAAIINRPS